MRVNKDFSFTLRKEKLTFYWTTYRYILAKSVYRTNDLTQHDRAVLNLVVLEIYESSRTNPEWFLSRYEAFNRSLQMVEMINQEEVHGKIQKMSEQNYDRFSVHHHTWNNPLSPRAFLGLNADKQFLQKYNRLLREKNRNLLTRTYEQRYIGVGYLDKGSARNTALDGSPNWQEVAMSRNIDEKINVQGVLAEIQAQQLDLSENKSKSSLKQLKLRVAPKIEHLKLSLKERRQSARDAYEKIDTSDKLARLPD